MKTNKTTKILRRKLKIRSRIIGSSQRPRLAVFRSNKHIQIQLFDDNLKKILLTLVDYKKDKKSNIESARDLGKQAAEKILDMKITQIVFDRGGYKYHGRVKALADGARESGLKF